MFFLMSSMPPRDFPSPRYPMTSHCHIAVHVFLCVIYQPDLFFSYRVPPNTDPAFLFCFKMHLSVIFLTRNQMDFSRDLMEMKMLRQTSSGRHLTPLVHW
jgi:hypothetical protein